MVGMGRGPEGAVIHSSNTTTRRTGPGLEAQQRAGQTQSCPHRDDVLV